MSDQREPGPQRGPSSVGQIEAQAKQARREVIDDAESSDAPPAAVCEGKELPGRLIDCHCGVCGGNLESTKLPVFVMGRSSRCVECGRVWVIAPDDDRPLKADALPAPAGELERLRAELARAELAEARAAQNKAESALEMHGYRRCDIAACNCGGYHGGENSASARLREIRESLSDAGIEWNGTILQTLNDALAKLTAAEAVAKYEPKVIATSVEDK